MADQKLSKLANDLAPLLRRKLSVATVSGGNGSGGGVVDHGQLTGLADNDHPQYLLRTGGNVMAADLEMSGYDINNAGLINGFDITTFGGTLTGLQMDVAALKLRTVLAGDGLDSDGVLFGDGSPTLDVVVADFAGAGLQDDGSNNLRVRAGDGIALDGLYTAVDLAFDFDWTGLHTFADSIGADVFNSADPITGWRIDADGQAWFAGIEATSLTVKTFISDVTLALQGSQYITKSKAELSRDFTTPATTGTLYVHALPGQPSTAVFESGDRVRLRYVNRGAGLDVGDVWGTVSDFTNIDDDEQSWTFTRTAGLAGETIYAGMVALDYGVPGDGYIELSSLGSDTPVIVLRTWVSDPSVGANHTTRAVLGNLGGITDADYGLLSGYGLFADLGYLKGTLAAGSADVVIGDYGINIAAGDTVAGDVNTIQWKIDPLDHTSATIAGIYGVQYEESLQVYNFGLWSVGWGGSTGADIGVIELRADEAVGSGAVSRFTLTGQAAPSAELWLEDDSNGRGMFTVKADVTTHGHIVPASTNGMDLGSGSKYFRAIYVNQIFSGTTYSTDTGHDHNDLYNTKAEITALLAGKANATHSHAGYVTSVSLATTLADYIDADALALELDDFYTKAAANALLNAKANAVHYHALADLSERNYSSLTSRGHVLADADGLGADHTVTGLTAGYVLRATAATAAKFMRLDYADLGDKDHALDDHTGDLTWSRVSKTGSSLADLVTRNYAQLNSRTHDILSEHSVTASRYYVVGTPNAANTLAMWATTDDAAATPGALLRADDAGALTLATLTATAVQSPDYVANSSGYYLTADYAEFNKLFARGSITAAVFEMESTAVLANRQLIVRSGGMLAEALAIDTGSGLTYEVAVEYPERGPFFQFRKGDVLAIKGLAQFTTPTGSGDALWPNWMFTRPQVLPSGLAPASVWLEVTGLEDVGTHFVYTCIWKAGSDDVTFRPGEAVASYGKAGDGGIESIATGTFAPRMRMFTHDGSPWNGVTDHLIFGDIGDLTHLGALATSWGGYMGDDASDVNASYILAATGVGVQINNGDIVRKESGVVVGAWTDEGINLFAEAPASVGESWTQPNYSALTWTTTPDDLDAGVEYGAVRLMTRRTYVDGFGAEEEYLSTVRTSVSAAGHAMTAGDAIFAESILQAKADGSEAASVVLRSYYYSKSQGTEMELNADAVVASGERFRFRTPRISMANLPRSASGLSTGDLWNDNGTIKVK